MCLGKVANKLFGTGGSKSAPKTPDPVGKESPTAPVVETKPHKSASPAAPKSAKKADAAHGNAGTTSMTNTGINY